VQIRKIENEYFADNVIIYIDKRISEKFNYD